MSSKVTNPKESHKIEAQKLVELTKHGFCIIPLKSDKRPAVRWSKYQEEKPTPQELETWYNGDRFDNVGLVCGQVSAGFEVIDFDQKHFEGDLFDYWSKRATGAGLIELVETLPIVETPSGGFHVLFRCDYNEGNRKLAGQEGQKEYFIETRGAGGYVAGYPSEGYTFKHLGYEDIPTISKGERECLFSLCLSLHEWKEEEKQEEPEKQPTLTEGERAGDKFNQTHTADEVLRDAGYKEVEDRLKYKRFIKPSSSKTKAKDAHITFKKDTGRVHCFTSDVFPDTTGKSSYSAFDCFTYIHYSGDYREATKAVCELLGLNGHLRTNGHIKIQEDSPEEYDELMSVHDIFGFKVEKGKLKISVDRTYFIEFLGSRGFFQTEQIGEDIYVKLVDGVVSKSKSSQMKKEIVDEIDELDEWMEFEAGDKCFNYSSRMLKKAFMDTSSRLFTKDGMEFLEHLNHEFLRDNGEEIYFCFDGGVVVVRADSIRIEDYSALNGAIWDEQKIKQPISIFSGVDLSAQEKSMFSDFLNNVCSHDSKRVEALMSNMGFILSGNKKPSEGKMPLFTDEEINEDNIAMGGTGKTLVYQAIKQCRSVCFIDAKTVRPDGAFLLQNLQPYNQCIFLDDFSTGFPVEILNNMITGEMVVEKKNKGSFVIPFELSPKFFGASNTGLIDFMSSTQGRRMNLLEYSNFYSKELEKGDNDVIERVHGKSFFTEDWSHSDWAKFYKVMFLCAQTYLRKSLIKPEVINAKVKKVIQDTSADFVAYMDDTIKPDVEYSSIELLGSPREYVIGGASATGFLKYSDEYEQQVKRGLFNTNKFGRWVKKWAHLRGFEVISKRINGKVHYIFKAK